MSHHRTMPAATVYDDEGDVYVTVDAHAVILDRFDAPGVDRLLSRRGTAEEPTAPGRASRPAPAPLRPRWARPLAE